MPQDHELQTEEQPTNWLGLMLFLLASYGAGFVGWFATKEGLPAWYAVVPKPAWAIPVWLFAPAQTVLYFLIGYAAWQVWEAKPEEERGRRKPTLALFFAQVLLLAIWPWVFFWFRQLYAAVLLLDIQWLLAAAWMMLAFRIRTSLGLMLLPFLAWVTYLAAMSYAIWNLNGR